MSTFDLYARLLGKLNGVLPGAGKPDAPNARPTSREQCVSVYARPDEVICFVAHFAGGLWIEDIEPSFRSPRPWPAESAEEMGSRLSGALDESGSKGGVRPRYDEYRAREAARLRALGFSRSSQLLKRCRYLTLSRAEAAGPIKVTPYRKISAKGFDPMMELEFVLADDASASDVAVAVATAIEIAR